MEKQLAQLDSEVADLNAKEEAAWRLAMSVTDPQQKAELKERHEKLEKRQELLNMRRAKLEDKLPSSGEHIVQTAYAR